jgi:flagellar basal body-associated protein FliL
MKIPKLLIRPPAKKKLRASTARRSMAAPDEMDYEEMSEPNMKLSRALLIVLVLHVVAVAGIIAFNTIKSRQGAFPQQRQEAKAAPTAAPAEVAPAAIAKADPATAPITSQTATAMISKPAAAKEDPKQLEKIPKALPVSNTDTASGNFYVVAKGDNPVSIAKKLKVSQSELLAANNIDDPRKLQIGQKLIVPTPKKAKSKSDAN